MGNICTKNTTVIATNPTSNTIFEPTPYRNNEVFSNVVAQANVSEPSLSDKFMTGLVSTANAVDILSSLVNVGANVAKSAGADVPEQLFDVTDKINNVTREVKKLRTREDNTEEENIIVNEEDISTLVAPNTTA